MFSLEIPFQEQAVEFFKQQQEEKVNQETPHLWNKIVQKVCSYVTAIRLVKIGLPTHGGVVPHQLLLMNKRIANYFANQNKAGKHDTLNLYL